MREIDIIQRAIHVRDSLCETKDFKENPINRSLPIPPPYKGSDNVKLIIVGQDPTIRREASRENVTKTLNLNKQDALAKYIKKEICGGLGIEHTEIYATNLFKYFYTKPPKDTEYVLWAHLEPNLNLLKDELAQYPKCPIITLGQPVFRLLSGNPQALLNKLWGYQSKDKPSSGEFQMMYIEQLGRSIFPLPHITSRQRVAFYKNTLKDYLSFVKQNNPTLR